MKTLFKSGLCLALSWLASSASAQDIPIKWQAATPKNSNPIVAPAKTDTGVRAVGLNHPAPLDGAGAFTPIVRMQAPDDKIVQPLPKVEVIDKPLKKMPMEPGKDGFTPPTPSPVFGGLGITSDDGCGLDCCPRRSRFAGCFTDGCCDRPRCWATGEYLLWWQRASGTPPLVTSSPVGTTIANTGVLGLPATTTHYDRFPDHTRSGGRFTLGCWLPRCCNLGIDANFLFLGRQSDSFVFGGSGDPQFARPFFNVVSGTPGSELVSFPGLLTGTVTVNSFSELWGAEINLRKRMLCGPCAYLDCLFGYRHLNLYEGIDITENLQVFDPATGAAAGNFRVYDSFRTRNQFNGFNFGLEGEWHPFQRWFIGGHAKVALGTIHQSIIVDGNTTFTNFPAPFGGTFPGGLLALPGTNIGNYADTRFGVLPEFGVRFGYDITEHCRVFVGYNFLYLNTVVRPGDQIDLRVNPTFQPSAAGPGAGIGPRFPTMPFHTTSYWAQGLTFGLQYRY